MTRYTLKTPRLYTKLALVSARKPRPKPRAQTDRARTAGTVSYWENGVLLSAARPHILQKVSSNWLPISRVSAQNWEHSLYPIMLDKFELLVFKDQVWRIFRSLSGRILNIPAESISLWNHHDTSFESWTLIFRGIDISGRSWENGRWRWNDRLRRSHFRSTIFTRKLVWRAWEHYKGSQAVLKRH